MRTPPDLPAAYQAHPFLDPALPSHQPAHTLGHTAYKRRQFLHDLLPVLFPAGVYGAAAREEIAVWPTMGPLRS